MASGAEAELRPAEENRLASVSGDDLLRLMELLERRHLTVYRRGRRRVGETRRGGRRKVRRAVQQVELGTGKVLQLHSNLRSAAKCTKVDVEEILDCIAGDREEAGGFGWRECSPQSRQPSAQHLAKQTSVKIEQGSGAESLGVLRGKYVEQLDATTLASLRRYSSQKEAALLMQVPSKTIGRCCRLGGRYAHGFFWRYCEDPPDEST